MTLKELIEEKNFTIKQVSTLLKLSKSSLYRYSKLERLPPITIMQKLADALNVDLQIIVDCFLSKESKNEIQNIKGVTR